MATPSFSTNRLAAHDSSGSQPLGHQPEAPHKTKQVASQMAKILKHWVTLPADHHPNELHLASKQLVDAAKTQLGTYHHLFDPPRPLPKGYLLPKESKKWMGARPIVAYFHTNTGRLSQFVAVALTQINDRVLGRDMALPSVSFILKKLRRTME